MKPAMQLIGIVTAACALRCNIQLWALPVTAGVLWFCSVRCWRSARNDLTDGLARSENGSEFQSTMVHGKNEYL